MTMDEAKLACRKGLRVIVREPGKAARRAEKITSLICFPNSDQKSWTVCCEVYDYIENPDTRHVVKPEFIEVDENQHGEGFTQFLNFKEELKKRTQAQQMKISEIVENDKSSYKEYR